MSDAAAGPVVASQGWGALRRTSPSGPTVAVPGQAAVLGPFVEAGVFDAAEVQLAAAVARLSPELSDEAVLAVAVAARGPRLGHVCVELAEVARRRVVVDGDGRADDLPWPAPDVWAKALEASDVVAREPSAVEDPLVPLVWDGRRLYLQRYWHHERVVAQELRARSLAPVANLVPGLDTALGALFPVPEPTDESVTEPDLQRRAAELALTGRLTILAGGPGTGKTHTVARLLAAAHQAAGAENPALEVALAAPTGKAAARMTEALQDAVTAAEGEGIMDPAVAATLRASRATTLHRLLGWAPGDAFRHHRGNPLAHDLVVVDETSMVSLPLMSHLLAALRPEARLVLVGDPFQLASVEAGSVMSDVVGPMVDQEERSAAAGQPAEVIEHLGPAARPPSPLASRIVVLQQGRRFSSRSDVAALAAAIRVGDADRALEILAGPGHGVDWVADRDGRGLASVEQLTVDAAVDVVTAALAGDALAGLEAASRVKVLCATRRGPFGQQDWNQRIERATAARVPELRPSQRWYVGRPVIVTANDQVAQVANGDVGLVVRAGSGRAIALPIGAGVRFLPAARLEQVETWWSMTIHKSQGSELAHVVVSLPSVPSPILSRELLYTAVTRARERVTVIANQAALRAAIGRPVARASGLRDELWPPIHRSGHTPPLLSRT